MKITLVVIPQPASHDHDNVRFNVDGVEKGFGYKPRKEYGDRTIALQRCPMCGRENYAMNVSSGQCSWCPFNANDCVIKRED